MTDFAGKHAINRALRSAREMVERQTGLRIIKQRPWGLELAADLRQNLPAFSVGIVFDVGANLGQSALAYAQDWPRAEIHSFEPAQSLFSQLSANTAQNSRIHPHRLAFGMKPGEVSFIVDGELSHIRQEGEDPGGLVEETVKVERLDDFCAAEGVSRIDFLKIDTEGFDLDVLRGAEQMLGEGRIGFVQLEAGMNPLNTTHVPFESLKAHMEQRGYYLFGIYEQVHEWKTSQPIVRRTNPVFISPELWRSHKAS